MSIGVPDATLLEQAKHQIDSGEYRGAWSTYRDFRESLDQGRCDPDRLRVVDEAERAAEASFRAGAVGFESELYTLLFVARRLVADTENP